MSTIIFLLAFSVRYPSAQPQRKKVTLNSLEALFRDVQVGFLLKMLSCLVRMLMETQKSIAILIWQ